MHFQDDRATVGDGDTSSARRKRDGSGARLEGGGEHGSDCENDDIVDYTSRGSSRIAAINCRGAALALGVALAVFAALAFLSVLVHVSHRVSAIEAQYDALLAEFTQLANQTVADFTLLYGDHEVVGDLSVRGDLVVSGEVHAQVNFAT